MDDMYDFYNKIQTLLIKKDKECGQLKFLTSRITTESIHHIEDLCKSISEIFKTCEIKIESTDVKEVASCVQAFKYLMLNTDFKVQECLLEDITIGHLVDMCPSLSPYLFIEILWHLNYEEILVESLLRVPLDLCVEILDIAQRCIKLLDFERALNVLTGLITNTYRRFILVRDIGSQAKNITRNLSDLMDNAQTLTLLLRQPEITKLHGLPASKKYERYGLILKKVLEMTRCCIESRKDRVEVDPNLDKLYRITYGREPIEYCDAIIMEEHLSKFEEELVNLLLTKFKEIDCNIYMGWVEIQDTEDISVTLQRSIGIDCYNFMQVIKDDEQLSSYSHFIEFLQQLSFNPNSETILSNLSVQELCTGVDKGERKYIKELISRYKELDDSTFCYIEKNQSLLDKDDCLQLLEYLFYIIALPVEERYKQRVYTITMRMLSLQSMIVDLFEIVLQYILKHDASSALECPYTEENFKDFIIHNITLKTSRNLRTVLLFIIQNPMKILSILLKIAIGYPEYGNVMISLDDLFLLSPIMNIRKDNAETFLTNALKNICMEHTEWNTKKFIDLIQALLDRHMLTSDDIFNQIFIPYLETSTFVISNMKTVLNCIRTSKSTCTKEMHVDSLLLALAKRMSDLRKSGYLSRYTRCEILNLLIRLIKYYVADQSNWLNVNKKEEMIGQLQVFLEPIDKPYFAPLWFSTRRGISIIEMMQDYERRCFAVVRKVIDGKETKNATYDFLRKEFLCHLILRCTKTEYMNFALKATIHYADYFNWFDVINAYDKFAEATFSACLFCMEFPKLSSHDGFAFLIKCLAKYTKWFVSIDDVKDYNTIYKSIVNHIYTLERNINHLPYSHLYTDLLTFINNTAVDEYRIEHVLELVQAIDNFGNRCLEVELKADDFDLVPSPEIIKLQVAIEFISACMKIPASDTYECFSKLDKILFPKHYTNQVQN